MDVQMDGRMARWVERVDGWMDSGQKHGQIIDRRQMIGRYQTDGQRDNRYDGWMDGWI